MLQSVRVGVTLKSAFFDHKEELGRGSKSRFVFSVVELPYPKRVVKISRRTRVRSPSPGGGSFGFGFDLGCAGAPTFITTHNFSKNTKL